MLMLFPEQNFCISEQFLLELYPLRQLWETMGGKRNLNCFVNKRSALVNNIFPQMV